MAHAAPLLSGTVEKVRTTGVITLGVRQVAYSYDNNIKIVVAIKKKLNLPDLQVKEIPITSQNRITLLQNGLIDIECGSTTNNLERQKQVAFTDAIFIIGSRLLGNKESGIRDWSDLKGGRFHDGRRAAVWPAR